MQKILFIVALVFVLGKTLAQTCSIGGPSSGCTGQSLTFSAGCTGSYTIAWSVDDVFIGNSPTLTHTFSSAGTHKITMSYTASGGGFEELLVSEGLPAGEVTQEEQTQVLPPGGGGTVNKNVTISASPAVPAIQASPGELCSAGNVTINITNAQSLTTYSWTSVPSGFTGSGASVTFNNVGASTQFKVVASKGSCSSQASATVNLVTTQITPVLDPAVMYGKRTIRGNTSANSFSHYWQTSPSGTSTVKNLSGDYEVTESGNYYIRRRGAGGGCWSPATGPIVVTVEHTPPVAAVAQVKRIGFNEIFFVRDDKDYVLTYADYYWVNNAGANPEIISEYIRNGEVKANKLFANGVHYLKGKDRAAGTWGPTLTVTVELRNDNILNWVQKTTYDGSADAVMIAESRDYFDLGGKLLQSQTRNLSDNYIFATQNLHDSRGRVAGTTLPAPIASKDFAYNSLFLEDKDQNPYSYGNFDTPDTRYSPDTVGNQNIGTVGWYYSDQNTIEPNVGKTHYPYSRVEFYEDGTGEVKRSASPGDQHRLGMGHEVLTGTFPVWNELADYRTRRLLAIPGITQDNAIQNGAQTVSRDENGKYAIAITDKAGKTVMTARSGAPQPGQHVLEVTNSATGKAKDRSMIYFYILHNQPVTINVVGSPAPGAQGWSVENIVTGERLPVYATFADSTGNWPAGFYRVIVHSGEVTVSYKNYYQDVSYQFYDDAGRLKVSVSPNGFKKWVEQPDPATNFPVIDKTTYAYNFRGWLLSMTEPDAGTTTYQYRRDGKIRFSQNAQQALDQRFSYTNYDVLGRPIESGEYKGTAYSYASLSAYLEYSAQPDFPVNDKKDWVKTFYDEKDNTLLTQSDLPSSYQQEFVRGAVSYTENENIITWYSYDELGRVTWMAQKPKALNRTFVSAYRYDFPGNVLEAGSLSYQDTVLAESFYHHYTYDKDKRLKQAYTSVDGVHKSLRAAYEYYLHGPLKRIELGNGVQGIDFTYNIHGWLTQINHPSLEPGNDPGGDGANHVRNDVFGMSLDYYESEMEGLFPAPGSGLYNGIISSVRWQTEKPVTETGGPLAGMYVYAYDDKYQVTEAKWAEPDCLANTYAMAGNKYKVANLAYDPNGNIQSMMRYNQDALCTNNFTYAYEANTNKLTSVSGHVNAYAYNAIGQMTGEDKVTGDDQYVEYDVSGKVRKVFSDAAKTQLKAEYLYDDRGFRLAKATAQAGRTTWYIRDASGSVLSIYEQDGTPVLGNTNPLTQTEVPVYGAGKLGTYYPVQDGSVNYEITDHLGNVRALIRDNVNIYTATMEDDGTAELTNPRVQEMQYFQNLFEAEKEDARFNHTPGGEYSAYLYWIGGSATAHKQIGPAIALKVTAGDTVKAETWVRYENKLSYSRNTSIAALAALLGGNFSFTQPFETYTLSQTANTFSNALTAAGFMGDGSDEERPFAYINYILFDENMTMVDAGWKRVDEDAGFDPGQEALTFHQHKKLAFDSTIKVLQDGYIYIWVSNESEGTKVWFDDVKVTHTQVVVTQATDYGVWGDVLRELKSAEITYRHGYQGNFSEKDEETGWNHFELRQYDPIIGRWISPDPYDEFWSPYIGMGNNPMSGFDPDGGDVIILNAPNAAGGYGHAGLLVGNDETGWRYISKEGTDYGIVGPGNELTNSILVNKPVFATVQEFLNSEYNKHGRYHSGIQIVTDEETDANIIAKGDLEASQWYDLTGSNCIQTCTRPLVQEGILPKSYNSKFLPNKVYWKMFDHLFKEKNYDWINMKNFHLWQNFTLFQEKLPTGTIEFGELINMGFIPED